MFNFFKKFRIGFKNDQKGMTIIELIVVIAIFMILTAITIFDYSRFRSSVSLDNLASDIALSVRKAQSYAIGVRGSSSSFNEGYGISFVTSEAGNNPLSGSNKSFVIFKDVNNLNNNKNRYDFPDTAESCGNPTQTNECLEILNITGPDIISEIYYVKDNNGKIKVSDDNKRMDIVFRRPNPDALFCNRPDGSSSGCPLGSDFLYVIIEISNGEIKRNITIWNTGQIGME